jgi:hypothetical protein
MTDGVQRVCPTCAELNNPNIRARERVRARRRREGAV